ncbi:MAG TPA: PAS domain-containing protein [Kamptonema sp.]|nr:PAS domain-containing protein [Kamptonema sp.]
MSTNLDSKKQCFQLLQALQEQLKELSPPQQALLNINLEGLSANLQELVSSFQSPSERSLVEASLQETNVKLERKIEQQAVKIKQLEEELHKEQNHHRRTTQALSKNGAKLQGILRYSSDLITILEADGRVRYHSPALEMILGYKPEDRVGKVHGELIHADDISAWQSYFALLMEKQGVAPPIEYRERHNDGSWVYMEAIANNLLLDSSIKGIVINSRNITERKQADLELQQANQLLQALIQASPLAIVGIDTQRKGLLWNPAAEQLFGWSSEEVLGQILPIIPEKEMESFSAALQSEFKGKVETKLLKARCLKKDGSAANLFFWSAPLRDGDGQISGVMRIYSDISDTKLIEGEMGNLKAVKNSDEPFWVRYVRPPKRFTKESER